MTVSRNYSLQRRLLWLLGVAIIAVAALQAALAYRAALAQADAAFDAQMKQLAVAIHAGRFDGSQPARDMEELDFVVQTWSADGRIVYQSTRRRIAPTRRQPGYSIARTGDKTYRVYATDRRGVSVQVSQDMDARASKARSEALRRTWPIALLGPLLVLLAGWVIRRSLAPVERVGTELSERRAGQLEPIDDANLPIEVKPVVNELNELFERVSQTLQSQQDFVADAAHELRSPLTAVKLQVQNLRKDLKSLPASQEGNFEAALQRLDQGIARAARMTDQLIHMAQQQAPLSQSGPAQSIDLSEIARDVIIQMAPQATEKNIDLGLHQAAALTIKGWQEPIRVLARNLISNAVKYSPPNGTVDVSITTENGLPCLIVEDNGPGIDPTQRERVLDRFYRGRQSVGSGSQGTSSAAANHDLQQGSGLGLAIVNAIAQHHHADLQLARSPRLGGLRARVQFPAETHD